MKTRLNIGVNGMISGLVLLVMGASPLVAEEDTAGGVEAVAVEAGAQAEAAVTAGESGPMPGHSMHGEAFNEGPRQKAYLMSGTGKIDFPVTTRKPEAQAFINQGVGQLHGFWYFESERSFRQAAAIDPDCAMAYWGMAMSNLKSAERAKGFIAEAVSHMANVSEREKMYIEALAAYHNSGESKDRDKTRQQAYINALEELVLANPHDIEAKAFLAFYLWEWRSNVPSASTLSIDSLVQQVLDVEPTHPSHHYRIHLWDRRKAEAALPSAARCGQTAPGIAHMWHMSGHIYDKTNRYHDAAYQQEASARVDHAHMMRDRVLPDQIHNYAHNNEWLVRTLMTIGRANDAVDLASNMIELPRHPKYNDLSKGNKSGALGRQRLAEALERFELWEALLDATGSVALSPTDEAQTIRNLRLRGVALMGLGRDAEFDQALTDLEARHTQKLTERDAAVTAAKDQASRENKDENAVAKAGEDAGKPFATALGQFDIALAELRGHKALREKRFEEAMKEFALAKDTPKHRLAYAHLAAGDTEKAIELASAEVKARVWSTLNHAVLIDVLWKSGDESGAVKAFEAFLPHASEVDLSAPAFARLAPVAKAMKLPEDWRPELKPADDLIDRPALETLGPFRWQPMPAESWTLPNHESQPLSLKDYAGKPVLVIFYLGAGCVHCTEQLATFKPMTQPFADAGVTILAISSDSVADLKASLSPDAEGKPFPFPIVSDAKLDTFRAYRAYDDFEHKPLHGTFLIDADGLVRWQDIGYEPFMDAAFLLEESRRLLAIPVRPAGQVPHAAK